MLKIYAKKLNLLLKEQCLYVIITQKKAFVNKNRKIIKLKNAIFGKGRALCLLG